MPENATDENATDQEQSPCSCGVDIAGDLRTKRELAEDLIERIDRYIPKWQTWFPNEQSTVGVPRDELLAMKAFAEIGLRDK